MIKMDRPLPQARSALRGSEAPSTAQIVFANIQKDVRLSILLYLPVSVLINSILNDALWNLSAFLTRIIIDHHL